MGAPQYEQAGADIGGTGTTNTIPRWTGPSTLGDSGLIDDGTQVYTTTRNLAIGAATAWAKLVAQGASDAGPTSTVKGIAGVFTSTNVALSFGGYTAAPYGMWIQAHDYRSGVSAQYPIVLQPAGGNVGIGTASPGYRLHVKDATNRNMVMTSGTTGMKITSLTDAGAEADIGVQGNTVQFLTGGTERARIDSAGRLLVGTTGTPTSAQVKVVVAGAGNGGQEWAASAGGGLAIIPETAGTGSFFTFTGNVGAESYTQSFKAISTGLDVSTSGYGLKLPATPGNADAQTLDCYSENTWTATDGSGAGLTFTANNTAVYTRVGRLVHVRIDITFPSTANGSNAYVLLPFNAIAYGGTAFVYASGVGSVMMLANSTGIEFYTAAGVRMTNGALSTLRIIGSIVYQAA